MARMSDEKYEYIQDVKEKRFTARSSHNKRTHIGKGGSVRFPSDSMTKKQREAMNGECKTYRLNDPMSWDDFKDMPDDLKVMYIKQLRSKFNVPDEELALAMDVGYSEFADCLREIELSPKVLNENRDWYGTDDHGRFRTWWIVSKEV